MKNSVEKNLNEEKRVQLDPLYSYSTIFTFSYKLNTTGGTNN